MRLRNSWILLAIALVFLVYFFVIEQPRHRESLEATRRAGRLTELTLADIHYVTIDRPGETVELTRIGDQWQLIAPVADLAARSNVNALVTSVVEARIARSIPAGEEDLDEYGLADPPAAVIRFATVSRDTVLTIQLGNYSITRSHCYARKPDSGEILLLPAGLRRYALLDLSEYRDDKVIRFELEAVSRFVLSAAGRSNRWHRTDRDGWETVVQGDTIAGDNHELEAILHRLRGLRVRRFISDNPAETGRYFTDSSPAITLWFKNEEDFETIRFEPCTQDSCYVKREQNIRLALADPAILAAFEKTVEDLRDRRLLHFDRAGIGKIGYRTTGFTAGIVKTPREWAYDNPALGAIEPGRLGLILAALENLEWLRVAGERLENYAGFGFDAPFMEITVWNKEGGLVDRLRCGAAAAGGGRYATSRTTRRLVVIDQDRLADIDAAFKSIRTK